jgi:hypothetical protein
MVINVIPLFDAHGTGRCLSGIRACQLRDSNSCRGVGKDNSASQRPLRRDKMRRTGRFAVSTMGQSATGGDLEY